jgi:O-antigen ligase
MDLTINLKFFSIKRTISISRQWIQYGIVAAAILLTTIIAYWGSPNIFVLLLGLLVGLIGFFALLRQPNLGFILVFLGGMFIPSVGPSGLSAATVMIAIMLGMWILDMFVVQKKVALIRTSVTVPIITFLVVSVVAFLIGQLPWFVFARQAPITAQAGGFAVVVFSVGGMLLAAHLIKDIRWLKIITWTFFALSALYMVARVFNLSFITGRYHIGFTAQSMSWTWIVALAAGQLIFNSRLSRRNWWLLFALVTLTLYVAAVQGFDWKSGWVPAVVAVAVLLGIRYRHLIVFAVPFVVMAVLYVVVDLIASDDYSWGTRVEAWRIVLEISRVSPFFGMGFANYYWYTPLFPIRGWRVSFNSHSQFVDLIAQTGYVGFFSFLWLFFALGRLTWSVARQLPDGFARGYAHGVWAGIIATMVAAFLGDWVLPFVYNVGLSGFRASILPWIFIGGVISLEYMLRSSTSILEDKTL